MALRVSSVTLAAAAAALILVAGSFIFGSDAYRSFISIEGLLIVVGGSVVNAFLSYPRQDVINAFHTIRDMLNKPAPGRERLHRDIMQLIAWSYIVQAQDYIGLEREAAKTVQDPLLRYGVDLVVTGYSADKIREMMHTVAEAEFERRSMPANVLRNMASSAPAFGMVGTLVGMVTILNHFGTDITTIGNGLAIAMLCTLYGLLMARIVCLPAADQLLQQEESEHFRVYMITEGLVLLADKQKPIYMQDRLNSFLQPSKHLDLDNFLKRAEQRPLSMAA